MSLHFFEGVAYANKCYGINYDAVRLQDNREDANIINGFRRHADFFRQTSVHGVEEVAIDSRLRALGLHCHLFLERASPLPQFPIEVFGFSHPLRQEKLVAWHHHKHVQADDIRERVLAKIEKISVVLVERADQGRTARSEERLEQAALNGKGLEVVRERELDLQLWTLRGVGDHAVEPILV